MINDIKHNRLLNHKIKDLSNTVKHGKIIRPGNLTKFIFLCGANKSQDCISERRKAISKFAEAKLPHTHFFLAEKMFSTLQEEEHDENILDIEHFISAFSDYILIILESPSAFAELGAFSHKELRDKIIVINDSKFSSEKSFINEGPLRAIKESKNGKHRLLSYKMSQDGIYKTDAIGDVFTELHQILTENQTSSKYKKHYITENCCNPAQKPNKFTAMFIHDLIFMTGPILYKEIVEVLKIVFGTQNFNNVKKILAILTSFNAIKRDEDFHLYRSIKESTYYNYDFDMSDFISAFRNNTFKYHPERFLNAS